jgi:peptidoglycan/xylan/chitin deacetylase (PgdA/CDA1 family)
MTAWLDPLRAALDEVPRAVTFFFRDDDAGWRDDRLTALLDVFAARGVPIDLAAIPLDLGPALAASLMARAEATGLVAVHQHGYAHVNHEPEGRRCEFGPSRPGRSQLADIEHGRRRLGELLGPALQPMFTPPWNRCTAETGACLVELGVAVLSRDRTAGVLGLPGLRELPVQVDWFAKRKGEALGRAALGELLAARAAEPAPLGVMLHHAVMEQDDMTAVGELLDVVATHDRARCLPMAAVLEETTREAAR